MSATTVRLLQAAAEIVGGNRTLAYRLGVGERLLAKFMADSHELPDLLLLKAVDIILADRVSRGVSANKPAGQSLAEGVQEAPEWGRGSGATSGRGQA